MSRSTPSIRNVRSTFLSGILVLVTVAGVLFVPTASQAASNAPLSIVPQIDLPASGTVTNSTCSSLGNCLVGGWFDDGGGVQQSFYATEINGVWTPAQEIPGLPALNLGDASQPYAISCSGPGDCAIAGSYRDVISHTTAYIATETNGVMGTAIQVPGLAALGPIGGGYSNVGGLSCSSAGNCSAGGYYYDSVGGQQAFVDSEVSGVWQNVTPVVGDALGNAYEMDFANGGTVNVSAVSCPSDGNCSAVGTYRANHGNNGYRAFVMSEVNGIWLTPEEEPGTDTFPVVIANNVIPSTVLCDSPGNCFVSGFSDGGGYQTYFDTEVAGVWNLATYAPALAAPNTGSAMTIDTYTCSSSDHCVIGGSYNVVGGERAFVDDEVLGSWEPIQDVPGVDALDTQLGSNVDDIVCPTSTECWGSGYYYGDDGQEPFVSEEVSGVWQTAQEPPGIDALNTQGGAEAYEVNCVGTTCTVGGYYTGVNGEEDFSASLPLVIPSPSPGPVTGLSVSGSADKTQGVEAGTIVATWYPSAGATTYTCTLLYGFDNPSQFTVTTTMTSCTFTGLLLSTGYGVSVAAVSSAASTTVSSFGKTPAAPVVEKTIWCHRNKKILKRTGVKPVCPAGYLRGR